MNFEENKKKVPPQPPPTEYAYRKPPQPPKPRCIADEPGDVEKHKRHSEVCVLLSFSVLFITCLIIVFYPDPRIDPKRTDHAVQAGIRECERTLPRTQTCELSELSFKVVEKK